MLEEQQGTNYRLSGELAAKEEQILRLKQALDQRKSRHQGNSCKYMWQVLMPNIWRDTWREYHARNIMLCQVSCSTTLYPACFLACNVGSLHLVYCEFKAGLFPGVTAAKALQ